MIKNGLKLSDYMVCMGYIGVDSVDGALERSKDVLLPFDFMTWTKLAVIMIFVGGSGISGFTNLPFSSFSGFEDSGTDFGATSASGFQSTVHNGQVVDSVTGLSTAAPTEPGIAALAVVGGLLFGLAVLFGYLNSLAKFVLLRGLNDRSIEIRSNISRHYFDALKYTVFNFGMGILVLGLVAAWIGSFVFNAVAGVLLTLLLLPILLVVAVFSGVVNDFALLEMINSEKGLIQSIKLALSETTEDWSEFGIYLVMRLVITTLAGIASFTAVMFFTVFYLVIFGLMTAAFAAVNSTAALIPIIIGLLTWLITSLYLSVPFQTFIHSYFVELYKGFMG